MAKAKENKKEANPAAETKEAVKVKALKPFHDKEANKLRKEGETWETTPERAHYLADYGFVKVEK